MEKEIGGLRGNKIGYEKLLDLLLFNHYKETTKGEQNT